MRVGAKGSKSRRKGLLVRRGRGEGGMQRKTKVGREGGMLDLHVLTHIGRGRGRRSIAYFLTLPMLEKMGIHTKRQGKGMPLS